MRKLHFLFLLILPVIVSAQKPYLVHLTIDKVKLGNDSVVYPKGKTFLVEMNERSDTIVVGRLGGVEVAILIDIRRMKEGEQVRTKIGYAYFKRVLGKWELIRRFGYIDRYELPEPPPGFAASAKKKPAHEEYHCEIGQPQQFEAFFRMDCYKK